MQTLAELQELAELAASYSAAYERARAVTPFDADALSVAAIDLASAAIDALYAIAAVAEQPQPQPQLSAALSKAAIVGAAALLERELAASGSIAPADASHALSDIRTLAQIVTDAVRSRVNRSQAAGCSWVNRRMGCG